MVEVIPAIMPDNYEDLLLKAGRVKGNVQCAQIDVMDGKFVPSVSWPYDEQGKEQFKSMIKDGGALPFWEDIYYEIDLMVEHPEKVVLDWVALGAHRILVHIESIDNPKEIISLIDDMLSKEKDFECRSQVEFGIAIGAETPLGVIAPYIHDIEVVQLMGIKKIGYQGQQFDEEVIKRIEDLQSEYPHLIISVDGGVNFDSAPKLIKAGASRLVSGSTIFNSEDIEDTIYKLKQS